METIDLAFYYIGIGTCISCMTGFVVITGISFIEVLRGQK